MDVRLQADHSWEVLFFILEIYPFTVLVLNPRFYRTGTYPLQQHLIWHPHVVLRPPALFPPKLKMNTHRVTQDKKQLMSYSFQLLDDDCRWKRQCLQADFNKPSRSLIKKRKKKMNTHTKTIPYTQRCAHHSRNPQG